MKFKPKTKLVLLAASGIVVLVKVVHAVIDDVLLAALSMGSSFTVPLTSSSTGSSLTVPLGLASSPSCVRWIHDMPESRMDIEITSSMLPLHAFVSFNNIMNSALYHRQSSGSSLLAMRCYRRRYSATFMAFAASSSFTSGFGTRRLLPPEPARIFCFRAGSRNVIPPPLPRLQFWDGVAYSSFTSRFGTM
jgi:hypothetical protein